MSRHATFENFGMAFLTLFQVSTGDNWNGIMKVQSHIHTTSYNFLSIKRKKIPNYKNSEWSKRDERQTPLFLSSVLSSTLVMLADEKEMCLLSTGGTDFLTDGQGSDCASLHTHTQAKYQFPQNTHLLPLAATTTPPHT